MSQVINRKLERNCSKGTFKQEKAKLKLKNARLENHRLIELGALIESRCGELDLENLLNI